MTVLRLALQPSDPTFDHNGQLGSVMYHHQSVPFSLPAKLRCLRSSLFLASQMALLVKNLPTNAGGARDVGSIPGWEYPLE